MASQAETAIGYARQQLGKPYRFGATGPNAFDCSGLMLAAWKHAGINLPRTAAEQAKIGTRVDPRNIQAGDLIFSTWDSSPDIDHVAMALGGGQYINAPGTGKPVRTGTLNEGYMRHVTNVQRIGKDGGKDPGGGGGWIPGVPDPGDAGDIAGAIGSVGKGIEAVGSAVKPLGGLAEKAMWLALPSTWVRITAGVVGAGCVAVGAFFLAREARGGS